MTRVGPPQHQLDGFPDAVMHFVRAMEGNRREVAQNFGLSEIEIRALFRIAEAGSITPKALATDLLVTTGGVTGLSDRLIAAGLVTRVAHPEDRRSLFLELTEHGHVSMKQMHKDFIGMLVTAAEEINADQLDTASETLRLVTEQVKLRNAQGATGNPASP